MGLGSLQRVKLGGAVKWLRFLLLLVTCAAYGSPNVLNGGSHASNYIAPAILATVGSGVVDSSIFVDYDPLGTNATQLVSDSTNASGSYKSVASGSTVNHQPYAVMNLSSGGFSIMQDHNFYASLLADSAVLSWPSVVKAGGKQPAGTPPPVVIASVSSRESGNGGTGPGIEFAIEAGSCATSCTGFSYNGTTFDLTEDSWVSAEMAGFLASLQNSHPTWNWFDIKGAFRQTAANWATGYDPTNYGFGTISWPSANAVSGTSSIYLQAPGISIYNGGFYTRITLYPYRQTRRTAEVVYACTPGYAWPVKNEYTATDVSGGCGTLLYTSNGTDTEPMFTYAPALSGTVTFVAFTTDGSGNYSRVENFGPVSASFVVGAVCR